MATRQCELPRLFLDFAVTGILVALLILAVSGSPLVTTISAIVSIPLAMIGADSLLRNFPAPIQQPGRRRTIGSWPRVGLAYPVIIGSKPDLDSVDRWVRQTIRDLIALEVVHIILLDLNDAPEKLSASDEALIAAGREMIQRVCSEFAGLEVHLLLRQRVWSKTQSSFIARERKRGKIEDLIRMWSTGSGTFVSLGPTPLHRCEYLLVMDEGSRIDCNSLKQLVLTARRYEPGLAPTFIQPRIGSVSLGPRSHFQILTERRTPDLLRPLPAFRGYYGTHPYVDQGLIVIDSYIKLVLDRLPENRLQSYDKLQGALGGTIAEPAAVISNDASADGLARVRARDRWDRGDLQLIPLALSASSPATELRLADRWLTLRDAARVFEAPALVVMVALCCWAGVIAHPIFVALVCVLLYTSPILAEAVHAVCFADRTRATASSVAIYTLRRLLTAVIHGAGALSRAVRATHAVLKTTYRMVVSHRHLLDWTATAQVQRAGSRYSFLRIASPGVLGATFLALVLVAASVGSRPIPAGVVSMWVLYVALEPWLLSTKSGERNEASVRNLCGESQNGPTDYRP